jgi:hypothetical protein
MMKMSWTHSSKAVAIGVLLVVALGAAGPASGITFDGESPDSTQVGEEVEMQVTIEEPFTDPLPNEWTLVGNTSLENAEWTITAEDNTGEVVARSGDSGNPNDITLDSEEGIVSVTVELRGQVPEMEQGDFNYESREEEGYLAMELLRNTSAGNSQIGDEARWTAHRYTEGSQAARQAIESAQDSGASGDKIQQAIQAYNNANFKLAQDLASDAESGAESEEQTQTLLLFGGAAVVVILLAGGGYYVYQQQSRDTNKLQ